MTRLENLVSLEAAARQMIAAAFCSCVAAGGSRVGAAIALGNRRPLAREGAFVDADSLFEVASVSKVFTAHLAAVLHVQGRLDIDRPVFGGASVRELASHASGFTDASLGQLGVYGKTWPFADDAAYVRAVRAAKPSYAKGTKVVYACINAILLGFVLEDILGVDLDAAARQFVWGPLGMTATTWKNCVGDPRTVQIYTHGPVPLGEKGDENARHVARPVGNAGVFTSLSNLMRYLDDLANRRVFPNAVYDLLFTEQAHVGGRRRSFGWDLTSAPKGWSAATIAHAGYTGQYVAVDPTSRRYAVVLTNLSAEGAARSASYRARKNLAANL